MEPIAEKQSVQSRRRRILGPLVVVDDLALIVGLLIGHVPEDHSGQEHLRSTLRHVVVLVFGGSFLPSPPSSGCPTPRAAVILAVLAVVIAIYASVAVIGTWGSQTAVMLVAESLPKRVQEIVVGRAYRL